jgi:hypothetical protein
VACITKSTIWQRTHIPDAIHIYNAIFLKEKRSGTHTVTENSVGDGGVSYIDGRRKTFRNIVLACVLLRKNFWNGVPARSVTKISLHRQTHTVHVYSVWLQELFTSKRRSAIFVQLLIWHVPAHLKSLNCNSVLEYLPRCDRKFLYGMNLILTQIFQSSLRNVVS